MCKWRAKKSMNHIEVRKQVSVSNFTAAAEALKTPILFLIFIFHIQLLFIDMFQQ